MQIDNFLVVATCILWGAANDLVLEHVKWSVFYLSRSLHIRVQGVWGLSLGPCAMHFLRGIGSSSSAVYSLRDLEHEEIPSSHHEFENVTCFQSHPVIKSCYHLKWCNDYSVISCPCTYLTNFRTYMEGEEHQCRNFLFLADRKTYI